MSTLTRIRIFLAAAAAGLAVYLLAAPKPWAIDDEIKVWAWGGGAVALAGVLVLLATAGWWGATAPAGAAGHRARAPRWFWPLVGAAMIVTALMGALRLNHDFWADEEMTLRLFVQGGYKPDPNSSHGG